MTAELLALRDHAISNCCDVLNCLNAWQFCDNS